MADKKSKKRAPKGSKKAKRLQGKKELAKTQTLMTALRTPKSFL